MSDEKESSEKPNVEVILQRSFEAMWYQAEVLHKREMDKFESLDKRLTELEQVIRDRVMMFSQDIIATMKEMIATSHDHTVLTTLKLLALNSGANPLANDEDSDPDSHERDSVVVPLPDPEPLPEPVPEEDSDLPPLLPLPLEE